MLHLRRPTGALIGRSSEIRALTEQVERTRLISLVGPGGVGKTALAAELVHEVEPDFERIVEVELADAERPGDCLRLLAGQVLDEASPELDRLAAALDAVPTLIVLDNCEHLVDEAAPLVDTLLRSTRGLSVLATSRRPLGLAAEAIRPVSPLAVPEPDDDDPTIRSTPAIELFLERAFQASPAFEMTAENRRTVVAITRAADGIPLVIELTAALVRTTPLPEILRAIDTHPRRLGGERPDLSNHQRTLAASIDWSRGFLSPADEDLLDRLSVFVGGFPVDGARAVDPAGTAFGLQRLVDQSLVAFDPATERYRILEVVRLDAAARVDPRTRRDALARHLAWCLDVVSDIDAARFDADPDNRFPLFELELPNLCDAIRRCHERGDLDSFRALLGPIAVWWVHYLPPSDPALWADAFADDTAPPIWRANVESALSFLWSHRDDHRRARSCARSALALYEAEAHPMGRAFAHLAIGNAESALDDHRAARTAYEAALDAALETRHPYPELLVRVALARLDPDGPEAETQLQAALTLARGGFGALEATVTAELAARVLREGNLDEATRLSENALARARTHGYSESIGTALCCRAEVALEAGDGDLATALLTEARTLGRRVAHSGVIARADAGLTRAADLPASGATGRGDPSPTEPLSERELSVVRLLRGDLTQRDIADELYIAPSTVKTHVKSIYRKLGVGKRSHAITRAAELGLFDRT